MYTALPALFDIQRSFQMADSMSSTTSQQNDSQVVASSTLPTELPILKRNLREFKSDSQIIYAIKNMFMEYSTDQQGSSWDGQYASRSSGNGKKRKGGQSSNDTIYVRVRRDTLAELDEAFEILQSMKELLANPQAHIGTDISEKLGGTTRLTRKFDHPVQVLIMCSA